MKVLILHSLAPTTAGPGRNVAEFDLSGAVHGLRSVLPEAGVAAVRGEVREVLDALETYRPDVEFNACEAPLGRPDLEAHVAALLEWLGIPFTGSGSTARPVPAEGSDQRRTDSGRRRGSARRSVSVHREARR